MSRSTKKGPYIDANLLEKIQKLDAASEKKVIKTWARASMIAPEFVGHTLSIHNGKKFTPIYITEQIVGHRLGEFVPTRYFRGHGEAHTKEAAAKT